MEKRFKKIIILILAISFLGGINYLFSKRTNDVNSEARGITGQVGDGVEGRLNNDYALNLDPIKLIELNIKVLEILPTDTNVKTEHKITIRNGQEVSLVFGEQAPVGKEKYNNETVVLKICPNIIVNKGIEITIKGEIQYSGRGLITTTNRVMAKNYEEIIVTIFDNRQENKKLVARITPCIKTIQGAMNYPADLGISIQLSDAKLLKNEKLITVIESLHLSISSKGSYGYLNCHIKGEGVYVLGFRPFSDSKKVGVINGHQMRFKFEDDQFELSSNKPILDQPGKWILYGLKIDNPEKSVYIKRILNMKIYGNQNEKFKKKKMNGNYMTVFVHAVKFDSFKE